MPAQWLDGREVARSLREELRQSAQAFALTHGRAAHLALITAGEDHAALLFGQQVMRACRAFGVAYSLTSAALDVSEAAVRAMVARASDDPATDGVVVLLPMPEGIRQRIITEELAPEKDVDGLGPRNAGNLMLGYPSFVPGTAEAVMTLLPRTGIDSVRGLHVVIVGRSTVGGKAVAMQMLRQDATITICHSKTEDLASITRSADILVVSVGRPNSITGEMVRSGAVVLDAGINATAGGVIGDVHAASVEQVAGWLTPVPGGLGIITHLMVIRHTLQGPHH